MKQVQRFRSTGRFWLVHFYHGLAAITTEYHLSVEGVNLATQAYSFVCESKHNTAMDEIEAS